MIQRIQTLYLLAASVISGALIFVFPLWRMNGTDQYVMDLFANEAILMKAIPTLYILSTLLSLVIIFLFKDRKLQFVLGRVNILMNLFLLVELIYLSLTLSGEATVSEKGIGMFLPILAILLLVLANKAIKKDEDLVKSVDRLR